MPLLILGAILLLLLFLQNYGYKALWDKGLSYTAQFSAKEAFEGDRLFLREELVNRKFLPLPWVFVKLQTSEHISFVDAQGEPLSESASNSLYAIMSYTAIRRRKPFICLKRGAYNLRTGNLTASNLLHTYEYNKDFRLRGELLVFPKLLEDCEKIDLIYKQLDASVLSNRLINPDPFEFRGLREYQPTDPLRSVNFKATAVAQQLMVNIHAPTAAQRLVIALNLEDMNAPAQLHEQCIRLSATLAKHYISQDAGVGFYTNGRDLIGQRLGEPRADKATFLQVSNSPRHLYDIYECLARINLGVKCASMADYINQLTDKEQVYIFISSYYKADLIQAFQGLGERGIEAFLIVATTEPIDFLETDRMVMWNL